jgi:NAD(P)-dependent dehydrogenase (short-subunit alcohol dehydrogenase family)
MAADAVEKKVAVVTGASRGIGLAIAQALAGVGFNVAITARGAAQIKSAAKKIEKRDRRVVAHPCDVSKEEDVAQLFGLVKREFGHVDVLVNNAGYSGPLAPIAEMPLEQWQANLDTNLTGTFLCARAAVPLMRKGSTIVNNLSIAAKGYFEGMGAYVASKHGAMGFTLTLRAELRPKGIRVIALLPGATDTDIWKQFWPDAPRERMISSESVASVVVNAILQPENATVEELVIGPTAGTL